MEESRNLVKEKFQYYLESMEMKCMNLLNMIKYKKRKKTEIVEHYNKEKSVNDSSRWLQTLLYCIA